MDDRDGNAENYYKRSVNGGFSWDNDTRITEDNDTTICASIAVSGSALHVIWTDTRDGNWEVYCKRNPLGNTVGIENTFINNDEIEINISPNPALNFIHINTQINTSPYNQQLPINWLFIIRNILGEVVLIKPFGGSDTSLDVSALPCGFYMLEIRDTNKYIDTSRLVISR